MVYQICNKPGHSAWKCWYRMDSTYQSSIFTASPTSTLAKAFVTSASASPSSDWYLDSASTHHLTNDLSNLNFYQPYQGNDQVMVGNGIAMPIHNSSKGLLPTPTHSFHLNHVYHVPTLTNNLISIQKLTKDNNCTVTFDDSSFFVQDWTRKRREFGLKDIIFKVSISFLLLLISLILSPQLISALLSLLQLGIADLVIHPLKSLINLLSI